MYLKSGFFLLFFLSYFMININIYIYYKNDIYNIIIPFEKCGPPCKATATARAQLPSPTTYITSASWVFLCSRNPENSDMGLQDL